MLKATGAEIGAPVPSVLGGEKGKRGGVDHAGAVSLRSYRVWRYQIQAEARRALRQNGIAAARALNTMSGEGKKAVYPGDIHRTIDCLRLAHGRFAHVKHHAEYNAASYAGLVTCGSVWVCPVCAAKVQERRRLEIEQAVEWHKGNGGELVMVTFTFPHHKGQRLRDLLAKQTDAFTRMRKTRRYRDLLQGLGYLGLIRSLEIVHGNNGWHPHTHELWLVAADTDPNALRQELALLWMAACHRAGLIDSGEGEDNRHFLRHSVDVRAEVDSGDYIAKQEGSRQWTVAAEVAKGSTKQGRSAGLHPFGLLERGSAGDADLFLEYALAVRGKRQMFWTRGLKAAVGVEDMSDEELADQEETGATLLASIPLVGWSYVVGNDARAELLNAAEEGGYSGVCDFLRGLGVPESGMPLTERGDDEDDDS